MLPLPKAGLQYSIDCNVSDYVVGWAFSKLIRMGNGIQSVFVQDLFCREKKLLSIGALMTRLSMGTQYFTSIFDVRTVYLVHRSRQN